MHSCEICQLTKVAKRNKSAIFYSEPRLADKPILLNKMNHTICINLHQATSAGLGRLAAVLLDVVTGGLGIAASVVRAFEVIAARVRVEWFCACQVMTAKYITRTVQRRII